MNLTNFYSLVFVPTSIVRCIGLTNPTNGQVVVSGITTGSTATYSCNSGYQPIGDSSRTCQNSGQWNSTAPTCVQPNPVFERIMYIVPENNLLVPLCINIDVNISAPLSLNITAVHKGPPPEADGT